MCGVRGEEGNFFFMKLIMEMRVHQPEAVFKEKHGEWDPIQRERGEVGKISPIG
jgi:hypothetical protein